MTGHGCRLHRSRAWASRRRGEPGFIVVEAVVALMVLALVASAVVQMILSGYGADRNGRLLQTANAVATRTLETARAAGYSGLVMAATDLAATPDPLLTTACAGLTGSWFYAPGGGIPCEEVVLSSGSGPTLPATPFDPGGGMSVRQYVTWVDAGTPGGPGHNYKRVTARVSWSDNGHPHVLVSSTLVSPISVAQATRGVTVAPPNATATVVAGGTAVFTVKVTNTGTTGDRFIPTVTLPAGAGWFSPIYLDATGSDSPHPTYGSPNPLISDTDFDGSADTGLLGSSASTVLIVAVATPATALGSYPVTVTVKSVMDPTKSATTTATISVTAAPVNVVYYLHNTGTQPVVASTAQTDMPADLSAPTGSYGPTSLPNLATDVKTGTKVHGRYLSRTAQDPPSAEASAASMADWIIHVPSHLQLSGTVTVTLWAEGCTTATSLIAYLGLAKAGADSLLTTWLANSGTVPVGSPGECSGKGAVPVTLSIPGLSLTLGATDYLELKVVAPSTAAADVWLGYDGTSEASTLSLPVAAT